MVICLGSSNREVADVVRLPGVCGMVTVAYDSGDANMVGFPDMIDLELLQKAVDESNDGIVIAEPEGDEHVLIYVNRAFERLTGYTADEILYRDCRFLQCDDRDQPGLDKVRAALRAGEPCCVRLRNYRKDGALFWNELSIAPVFNDKDQLTYYIGVQKDVTELVALEEKFRETEQAMSNALERLAELEETLQRSKN